MLWRAFDKTLLNQAARRGAAREANGTTPIEPGLLTRFLENDHVAIRVFYAEELKPVWCHFRTLRLQTSVREFLMCKLYIGATDVKHSILGPLLWRLHRALIRVILSVQHDLGSPKPQPHPMRKPAFRR